MDHVSAGEAQREVVRDRRRHMREQARSHRAVPVSDRYQTPEWLERSFVLPLTKPEASDVTSHDVPSQPLPSHDDDTAEHIRRVIDGYAEDRPDIPLQRPVDPPVEPSPTELGAADFVRPPSQDVDFARVVRRADLCRRVTRLHWLATGLAGLALVLYLLMSSVLLLGLVIVLALVAVVTFAARVWLNRAPVPRLRR